MEIINIFFLMKAKKKMKIPRYVPSMHPRYVPLCYYNSPVCTRYAPGMVPVCPWYVYLKISNKSNDKTKYK